ncbi:MAG: prephenate dehydratase [Deltaproteobacteria bacterium]|jgi:chorismate mutase/prephenate dehydratase|nr:prephenate dehydratase [Deltaproteobacteria bacterium]MBW2383428.1 prephenate dehydratase [Deltaproteobacteria bacterium]MBW2695104.1 prephenate dehydratase [Deltaproteobacteria bacterium]
MAESSRKPGTGESDDVVAELARLRDAIDGVDREVLDCLNRRAQLVQEVGRVKQGGRRSPVYVASRERDLVTALVERNDGPFPDAAIPHVFREIVSATRSLEERVRIAYLGPEGTFSHQAAVLQFGSQAELLPVSHMQEVFLAAERGEAHFGVIPVENTIEGAINPTYDALMECEVTICGEVLVDVSQNMLSKSGRLEDVRVVASIPQAVAQCRSFLFAKLPDAEVRDTPSTAAAAQLAATDASVAAIGSSVAADAYGLEFVARDIEDHRGNTTRFVVIGKETPECSGNDLTSAAFTVRRDQSGALYQLLEPFARHRVNLTAVQSRPMKGKPWEYVFFIDMEGHESEDAVGKALDEAAAYAHSHKILGSFPRAMKQPRRQLGRRDAR